MIEKLRVLARVADSHALFKDKGHHITHPYVYEVETKSGQRLNLLSDTDDYKPGHVVEINYKQLNGSYLIDFTTVEAKQKTRNGAKPRLETFGDLVVMVRAISSKSKNIVLIEGDITHVSPTMKIQEVGKPESTRILHAIKPVFVEHAKIRLLTHMREYDVNPGYCLTFNHLSGITPTSTGIFAKDARPPEDIAGREEHSDRIYRRHISFFEGFHNRNFDLD